MALNVDSAVQFAQDTSGTWPGLCDRFVANAYGQAHSGYKGAFVHWNSTPAKLRREGSYDAPVGSLVYWNDSIGGGWGHVAIVTGKDKNGDAIVTSTHGNGGTPSEYRLKDVMPNAYVGWAQPYFQGKVAKLKDLGGAKADANVAVNDRNAQAAADGMYLPQDQLSMKQLKRDWGIAAAVLKKNPELKDKLREILSQRITDPTRQLAMLQETDWFKKHTQDWMDIEKSRLSKDPAIWKATVESRAQKLKEQFAAAGAEIDDQTALKYAEQMIYGSGWNGKDFEIYDDQWLKTTMADAVDFTMTKQLDGGASVFDLTGAAEDVGTKLYDMAYQYGMDSSMSNQAFTSWFQKSMKGLIDGTLQEQDVDDELKQHALSMFPGMASQLDRGLTLRQAADPYLNQLASVLEMDPSALGLDDDLVQRTLNYVDDKGNFKPISLYDAKLQARRDPRFQYTSKAKQEYTDIGSKILSDFGFLG